jgi:short chain dehydrogenase
MPRNEVCGTRPLSILINNAGVAHYMPFAELPAAKAAELIRVKELAPAQLTRAAVPGMLERGEGTIINRRGDDRRLQRAGWALSKCPAGLFIPERLPTRSPGPSNFTQSWRRTA